MRLRVRNALFALLVLIFAPILQGQLWITPPALTKAVPLYLYDLGSGVEADPNGSATLEGFHQYANFTVPIAQTITLSTGPIRTAGVAYAGLYVKSPGTCTVTGTITGAGLVGAANGFTGGSGAGGGGAQSANAGVAGTNVNWSGNASFATAAGGTAGAIAGAGGTGNVQLVGPPDNRLQLIEFLPIMQSWGGTIGGAGGAGTAAGGAGGNGGGGLILDCNLIICTGTVTMAGAIGGAGNDGVADSGGGGGGGGGHIVFAGYVITDGSCTKTLTGGASGPAAPASGAGGVGGAGWALDVTL